MEGKVCPGRQFLAELLSLCLMILAVLFAPCLSLASSSDPPWQIEADQLAFYHDAQVVIGTGNVRAEKGKLRVFADRIVFDRLKNRIQAYGNLVIHMDQDLLRGSKGTIDLTTKTGSVEDAYLFLKRNNIYVTAKRIEKVGVEEYRAEDATLSTCPLPKQAWRFWCRNLKLNISGDAWAKHATFDLRTVPLLYSPVMYVPINRYRKTGLLLPEYTNSDRQGFGISVPFFLVLNDSQDMTFTGHYMSKRGWLQGVEYRHRFTQENRAILQYSFLNDEKADDDYNDDGQIRERRYRWWLRGKMDQELPMDFKAKLDVDLVSDRDFITEFDSGGMSFAKSNAGMKGFFGRSLAEASNDIRPSHAQIYRNGQDSFLSFYGRFNDNHIAGERSATVQTLPSLFFQGLTSRLLNTPLYYDFSIDYVDYWRDSGTKERRVVAQPSLSLPVDLLGWGDLVLKGGVEDSLYYSYGDDLNGQISDSANKFRVNLGADLSKTFARVYGRGDDGHGRWRHSIMPRIRYLYRSNSSMDDIPKIDRQDLVDNAHWINISLLSFVSSRNEDEPGHIRFRDIFRFNISQNYFIKRQPSYEMALDLPARHWSDLFGEIEFEPIKNFLLRYDTAYDHYDHRFRKHNFHGDMIFDFLNNSRLYFDYRYSRLTDVETGNIGVEARVTDAITLYYNQSQNFQTNDEVQSRYGIRYQSSCWSVTGMVTNNDDDTSFMVYLELLGIGGWSPPTK